MNKTWTDVPVCTWADANPAENPAWPPLPPDEIHVWKASLDEAALAPDRACLSSDERTRAGRFRYARDQLRFVTGRAILRTILGGYLGRDPAGLTLLHGPHGKPRLAGESLYFNVTHADSIALYAVARGGQVGIDIERVREIPDWAGIARNFFAPGEQERLQRLAADRRELAFLQAWTRREALLKTSGEGLAGETDGSVSDREAEFAVRSLIPAPGYLAALASDFSAQRVIFMTWPAAPGSTRSATPFSLQNILP